MNELNWAVELPKMIEHTQLAQEADASAISRVCKEAQQFRLGGVCVNPAWVKLACEFLRDTEKRIVTVAGFPLGASKTHVKVAEAAGAVEDGANEIDMVANIGWLISGQTELVEAEIRMVRRNLPTEVTLKVILEVGKLTLDQMKMGVECAVAGGADFVKTATGLYGMTTVGQVTNLVQLADGRVEVKAAGGIRTLKGAREMVEAGASRIGTSASVQIMAELIGGTGG